VELVSSVEHVKRTARRCTRRPRIWIWVTTTRTDPSLAVAPITLVRGFSSTQLDQAWIGRLDLPGNAGRLAVSGGHPRPRLPPDRLLLAKKRAFPSKLGAFSTAVRACGTTVRVPGPRPGSRGPWCGGLGPSRGTRRPWGGTRGSRGGDFDLDPDGTDLDVEDLVFGRDRSFLGEFRSPGGLTSRYTQI
jgi:hypothetical protein